MATPGNRADPPDQIEIHGVRFNEADIEEALQAHPGVERAVVMWQNNELAAYVVPSTVDTGSLRAHLVSHLRGWNIPYSVVLLDSLPLRPSGKLDRSALPPPRLENTYRAPRSDEERVICAIFAEVLQIDRVGIDDNLFDLGGDSLIAIQVVSRIRTALASDVSIRALFASPTPAALARLVTEMRPRPQLLKRSRRGADAPPILFPTEPTSIPRDKIEEAVKSILDEKRK
jgi:acyl carrier protein